MIEGLKSPLKGDGCRAELLSEAHREVLGSACAEDPDLWEIYYINYGPENFDRAFDWLMRRPDWVRFALYEGDAFVGMSSYLNIDDSRALLEIGSTYYRPAARGTGFNRRCKDMMIRHAFDCGYRRIEFRVDRRNLRSQAAMKNLGAVREGVLRGHGPTWNGHMRDTVLFAILKDEWPV
ncbi:MAG TPA: GNAT family protein [Sphingomicrobium sp.]|nr:GNAT family protein [Sphingomicrobium sp.]